MFSAFCAFVVVLLWGTAKPPDSGHIEIETRGVKVGKVKVYGRNLMFGALFGKFLNLCSSFLLQFHSVLSYVVLFKYFS